MDSFINPIGSFQIDVPDIHGTPVWSPVTPRVLVCHWHHTLSFVSVLIFFDVDFEFPSFICDFFVKTQPEIPNQYKCPEDLASRAFKPYIQCRISS
jgi:hypothetical protein